MAKNGTYRYACECTQVNCARRVTLTHPEYQRRSARGPVLALGCPELLKVARANAAAFRAVA